MKLPVFCIHCMLELSKDELEKLDETKLPVEIVEVRDDGRYEMTCPRGHKTVAVLQEHKFEVLFEIGAFAVKNGYYREAVSSFAASLERFNEFFLRAVLLEKLDTQGVDATIEGLWALIGSQSERQLGAYASLYAREFGRVPPSLSRKNVEFRNDVTHKGKIPERDETVRFGQAVLDLIRSLLAELLLAHPRGVRNQISRHVVACGQGDKSGCAISTMGIRTILSVSNRSPEYDTCTLEEAVSKLKSWEDLLGKSSP